MKCKYFHSHESVVQQRKEIDVSKERKTSNSERDSQTKYPLIHLNNDEDKSNFNYFHENEDNKSVESVAYYFR